MGTNYYWITNYCPHCNRGDSIHIGKHSGGWQFSFRAYPEGIWYKNLNPLTAPVMSWSDWKKVVVRAPEDRNDPLYKVKWGHIENEYGEVVPPDEFETMVERTAGQTNHTDYVNSHPVWREYNSSSRDFKDPDGWSMSLGEFS